MDQLKANVRRARHREPRQRDEVIEEKRPANSNHVARRLRSFRIQNLRTT